MRMLADIDSSHGLFQPHPTLVVSPRYPGLESLTALVHQLGLPVMVAATAVTLVARLVLVLVLCDAVEHLTGSPRKGGLAVAVYAVSAQFTFFTSQFAYQTLALPLALAAVAFIARARWAHDPRPLLIGATVCLLAVAVTHHITSWLTAVFLVCLGYYREWWPGEATSFLWRGGRSCRDHNLGDDPVVASAGLFRPDRRGRGIASN